MQGNHNSYSQILTQTLTSSLKNSNFSKLFLQAELDHNMAPASASEARIHEANQLIFGHSSFRHTQFPIIKSALQNEDVFALLPTGGGKSLCYMLPACLSKGVSIVISPLISLIQDQVTSLLQNQPTGIPAAYLNSQTKKELVNQIHMDLSRAEPTLKLLYCTPEKIVQSLEFRQILMSLHRRGCLARFVIDEAHCISSWGHDFRTDYQKLSLLKSNFPTVPVMALTATATPRVQENILSSLNIRNARVFSMSQNRANLHFEVRSKPAGKDALPVLYDYIMNEPGSDCCGIVYCMTQAECEKVAEYLFDRGIEADHYHAGQTPVDRELVQTAWQNGDCNVVCATIACKLSRSCWRQYVT